VETDHKEIKNLIAILPLAFGLRFRRLRINSFDVSTQVYLLNNRKNEGSKITDLTPIRMDIKFKKAKYSMN